MHMSEIEPQRDPDLYKINSTFQRHFWSLLFLPLNSGIQITPISSLISKIFDSSQATFLLLLLQMHQIH